MTDMIFEEVSFDLLQMQSYLCKLSEMVLQIFKISYFIVQNPN